MAELVEEGIVDSGVGRMKFGNEISFCQNLANTYTHRWGCTGAEEVQAV